MNAKIVKKMRKWCELRSLDYDTCKKMYADASLSDKVSMLKEIEEYNDAVKRGVIIAGPPARTGKLLN